jgi:signal transduction histidine kinase
MFEVYLNNLTFDQYIHKLGFLLSEVSITTIIILMVGYVFVQENFKPAESMVRRLNQFSQDASHELRTPLSNTNLSLDLALRSEEYEKYIKEAKLSLREATNIVDKLLALAKLDKMSIEKKKFIVKDSVEDVLNMFSEKIAQKDLTVEKIYETPDKSVTGDPGLFRIVVANLIDNAIKYNDKGGKIVIELTSKGIRISNTGETIDQEDLEMIFERFYQRDISRSDKGYGIGLAVVKKICEIHKWEVTVGLVGGMTSFILSY